MPETVIVLPTYNEAANIGRTVREVYAALPDCRIIVVDDNSPDGTAAVVRTLMPEFPTLSLHLREKKAGLGAAYKDILSRLQHDASVRYVIHMDVDGSHEAAEIPRVLEKLASYDFVVGSRYVQGGSVEGWERNRKLLSRFGNIYARTIAGIPLKDVSSGFIGMRRSLLERVDFKRLSGTGYAYLMEFKHECTVRLHARAYELPIHFKPRREGESKMTFGVIREGLLLPLKIRFGIGRK